jgi:hypothetical protein
MLKYSIVCICVILFFSSSGCRVGSIGERGDSGQDDCPPIVAQTASASYGLESVAIGAGGGSTASSSYRLSATFGSVGGNSASGSYSCAAGFQNATAHRLKGATR